MASNPDSQSQNEVPSPLKLKLTYFPVRGIAEVARMILIHTQVDFIDERLSQKEWAESRNISPYGYMPYLTLESGVKIGGSIPIYSFLVAKYGLGGQNDIENCLLMSAVDCLKEIWAKIPPYHLETDPVKKEELKIGVFDICRAKLPFLEAKVINGHIEGIVGDGLVNYSEFWIFQIFDHVKTFDPNFGDDFPKLKHIFDNVKQLPHISQWLKDRPVSAF